MSLVARSQRGRITTQQLLAVFSGGSPLSRRTIRRRLDYPKNAVVSKLIYTAVEEGKLRRVEPVEVGSAKHVVHVFVPVV